MQQVHITGLATCLAIIIAPLLGSDDTFLFQTVLFNHNKHTCNNFSSTYIAFQCAASLG